MTAEANTRVGKGHWTQGIHLYNGHTTATNLQVSCQVSPREVALVRQQQTSVWHAITCQQDSSSPSSVQEGFYIGGPEGAVCTIHIAKEQQRVSWGAALAHSRGLWGLRQTWVDGWQAALLEGRSPGPQQRLRRSRENRYELWEARLRALAPRPRQPLPGLSQRRLHGLPLLPFK